ncbi:protein PLANT CADMIUM RESISTANCE 2-like isoform X2 [Prosopis cineraria]|uniref:protein PLANT CADMIUM RESISTANCE 2-like isoform X2 n=1 Tax=Prosopis cineraria TaxID=364024 RepID=UPI0024109683|nr:protein PLANT CADMIUM RESISTANCE 2-like isoform X2 [Prosopis cineraria]
MSANSSWSFGFCGCCSDCGTCCLTIWCARVTFGRIAEIVDRGTTSCCVQGIIFYILGGFTQCVSCYACIYRPKIRNVYNIEGNEACDCLVSCFCPHMSLCQEYRELKARGFSMMARKCGNAECRCYDSSGGGRWHEPLAVAVALSNWFCVE